MMAITVVGLVLLGTIGVSIPAVAVFAAPALVIFG